MITFIIIGRNEGWKLTKCLQSVYDTISYNKLDEYEVIYVDSKSTDDSIERAKQFGGINIIKITGVCNAAIARNIGARESAGDILFFIDGDMEIKTEFLEKILDAEGNFEFDVVTGHLIDRVYDTYDNFIVERPRTYKNKIPSKSIELLTFGGIFVINRRLWEQVGGMKTKYARAQDLDLCLRLKKAGQKVLRFNFLIAVHNTIDYRNNKRMWKMLLSGNLLYAVVIFRDHIREKKVSLMIIRQHYTSLLLILLLLSVLFIEKYWIITILGYLIILSVRAIKNAKISVLGKEVNIVSYCFQRVLYQVLRDIFFLIGIVTFFPKSYRLEYDKVTGGEL